MIRGDVQTEHPIPLFERLLVETQANCNRDCWFCGRTYDRSGKYLDANGRASLARMPSGMVIDLLEQAALLGFTGEVGFHHYSEPLLDDRSIHFAREARARDMQPYLHTNGDVLLRRLDLCSDVAEVYTRVVVGLYDYTTDTERAEQEAAWREKLAGTRVQFSAIGLEGRRSGKSMAIPKARVPTDARMSIQDLTYPNGPCARPLVRMIIQHDGDVCNCCEDTTGAFALGNAFRQSLAEIWFGESHVRVVKDLAAGHREKYPLCRHCPLSPSGQRPDGARISMALRRHAETSG